MDISSPGRTQIPDWQLWPPSPKMQIAMIAAAFALFNVVLIVIVAMVIARQF